MVGAKAIGLTRSKSIHGRSKTAEQVNLVISMLAEAIGTERWAAAHRLVHGLELLTNGQTDEAWRAVHVKDPSVPWEVAAFRSRDGETLLPAAQVLALLEGR